MKITVVGMTFAMITIQGPCHNHTFIFFKLCYKNYSSGRTCV